MTDKLYIRAETSWHDCETCGSSEDHSLTVHRGEEEIIRLYHDGHLGDGNWEHVYDPAETLALVLHAMGYEVVLTKGGTE